MPNNLMRGCKQSAPSLTPQQLPCLRSRNAAGTHTHTCTCTKTNSNANKSQRTEFSNCLRSSPTCVYQNQSAQQNTHSATDRSAQPIGTESFGIRIAWLARTRLHAGQPRDGYVCNYVPCKQHFSIIFKSYLQHE